MGEWFKRNPWIWIVFFFLFVFGMNLALVVLSVYHRPEIVP